MSAVYPPDHGKLPPMQPTPGMYAGPSTYLNGNVGWPHQPVEDTYDLPPHTWKPPSEEPTLNGEEEYYADYGPGGEALLVKARTEYTQTRIASFDTFADAQKAAEALNNHEGL